MRLGGCLVIGDYYNDSFCGAISDTYYLCLKDEEYLCDRSFDIFCSYYPRIAFGQIVWREPC